VCEQAISLSKGSVTSEAVLRRKYDFQHESIQIQS
jgi:hypothetical protein